MALEEKTAKKNASYEVTPCELFGFGSGEYAEGPEANDIMGDISGRWVNFLLTSDCEKVIAEPDKRLPDHIKSSDIFGKASWFGIKKTGSEFIDFDQGC